MFTISGSRQCVCGTINHAEGSIDDKKVKLWNVREDCLPHDKGHEFYHNVLGCNATKSDVCQLGVCKTNGQCFKWLTKDEDKVTMTFGCFPEDLLQPPEKPFICHGTKSNSHKFLVACCAEKDGCNAYIPLELSSDSELSEDDSSLSLSISSIIALTVSIIAFILLLVFVAYFAWKKYQCCTFDDKEASFLSFHLSTRPSMVASTSRATDVTHLPLMEGEISQPSSTIREYLDETCSGIWE